MASPHTPGPWSVNTDWRYDDGTPRIIWGPKGAGYGTIAHAFMPGVAVPDGLMATVSANAMLLASAPDLALACRFALAWMDEQGLEGDVYEYLHAAYVRAVVCGKTDDTERILDPLRKAVVPEPDIANQHTVSDVTKRVAELVSAASHALNFITNVHPHEFSDAKGEVANQLRAAIAALKEVSP